MRTGADFENTKENFLNEILFQVWFLFGEKLSWWRLLHEVLLSFWSRNFLSSVAFKIGERFQLNVNNQISF